MDVVIFIGGRIYWNWKESASNWRNWTGQSKI